MRELKRFIVSGANGFIGSAMVRYLLCEGYEVLALSRAETQSNLLPKNEKLTYKSIILSPKTTIQDIDNKGIWDCWFDFSWAGASGKERENLQSQIECARTMANNVKLASEMLCQVYIGAGSLHEYETTIMTHSAIDINNINYYGYAKSLAHYMCKKVGVDNNIDVIWGVITNAYGPGERSERLINCTIRKILNEDFLNFSKADNLYNFIYITDAINAFYNLATKGKNNKEYIVGSGEIDKLRNWLNRLIAAVEYDTVAYTFNSNIMPNCYIPEELFSINNIYNDTGFISKIKFEDGIKMTADYIKSEKEGQQYAVSCGN